MTSQPFYLVVECLTGNVLFRGPLAGTPRVGDEIAITSPVTGKPSCYDVRRVRHYPGYFTVRLYVTYKDRVRSVNPEKDL